MWTGQPVSDHPTAKLHGISEFLPPPHQTRTQAILQALQQEAAARLPQGTAAYDGRELGLLGEFD